jgi:hypothetical protein
MQKFIVTEESYSLCIFICYICIYFHVEYNLFKIVSRIIIAECSSGFTSGSFGSLIFAINMIIHFC